MNLALLTLTMMIYDCRFMIYENIIMVTAYRKSEIKKS